MNVRIVIDSTADVTAAVREKCTVVPLTVHFGDEDFTDGVTLTPQEFYKKLQENKNLPTTSQPSPSVFAQVYQAAMDAGEEVVVLTISSKLSGTYQSASIAAMDFPGRVHVVDSLNAAIGSGILAELAVELAEGGMSAAEIAQRLTRERDNVRLVAVVDTLEYLKRGGRVSKTVAFAGELLSIKPVIAVRDGEVAVIGKVRGNKQANAYLNKEIEASGGVDFSKPVMLGYAGLDDEMLKKYIQESISIWENRRLNAAIIGSTIGTHVGPGAVAVAFFKNN